MSTKRNNRKLVWLVSLLSCVAGTQGFGLDVLSSPDFHLQLGSISHALPSILSTAPVQAHIEAPTFLAATADTSSPNFLEIASTIYRQELRDDPLKTKMLTGIFLAVVGDALVQSRSPDEYNVKRAVSFATFDGCYRAVQQFTYPPMIKLCSGKAVLSVLAALGVASTSDQMHLFASIEQTLVSQLIIIPAFYYPFFYAITGAVQGLTVEQTIARAKETFIPLMQRNLAFWIPVQFVAFNFVQENLQIPLLIVCGLVWTIILSAFAGAAKEASPEDEMEALDMQNVVLQDDAGAYHVMGSNDDSSGFVGPEKEMKNVDIAARLRRTVQKETRSTERSVQRK
jgi:protein Mpv17